MESKMRKKWLKIQQKFFNPEDSLRMVLFNIILYNLIEKQEKKLDNLI